MDERRSLALLAWTVGGIVGLMFTLNALALSLTQGGPPAARLFASHDGHSLGSTMNLDMAPAARATRG